MANQYSWFIGWIGKISLPTAVNQFHFLLNQFAPFGSTETNYGSMIGGNSARTFLKWVIDVDVDPGAGESYTWQVRQRTPGGAAADVAGFTVVITGNGSTVKRGIWTGNISISPGQLVTTKFTPSAGAAAIGKVGWKVLMYGEGQLICTAIGGGTVLAQNSTSHCGPYSGGSAATVYNELRLIATSGGTMDGLQMAVQTDPGGVGQSVSATLETNASPTYPGTINSLLSAVVNTGSVAASDLADSYTAVQGAALGFACVNSVLGANNNRVFIGYIYHPPVYGDQLLFGELYPNAGGPITVFDVLGSNSTVEATSQVKMFACTVKNFVVFVSNSGSNNTLQACDLSLTFRKNGVSQSLLVASTVAGAKLYWTDLANVVQYLEDDAFSIMGIEGAGGPGGGIASRYGFNVSVPQPVLRPVMSYIGPDYERLDYL